MRDFPENFLADMCYTFCKETCKMYVFNRNNESTEDLGRWKEFSPTGSSLDNEELLQKISVNEEGKLLFNGSEIGNEIELEGYTEEELLSKLGLTLNDYNELVTILTNSEDENGVPILKTNKTWHSSAIFSMLEKYSEKLKKYTNEEISKIKEASAIVVTEKPDRTNESTQKYLWYYYKVNDIWMQTIFIGDNEITLESGATNLDFQNYTKEEILSKIGLSEEELNVFNNLLTDETTVSLDKTWNSVAIKKYIDEKFTEIKKELGLSVI